MPISAKNCPDETTQCTTCTCSNCEESCAYCPKEDCEPVDLSHDPLGL